jgi:hypothetical protein
VAPLARTRNYFHKSFTPRLGLSPRLRILLASFFSLAFFLLFLAVVIGAKLFPTRATESWGWERGKLFFRLLLVDETISEISNIRIRIN